MEIGHNPSEIDSITGSAQSDIQNIEYSHIIRGEKNLTFRASRVGAGPTSIEMSEEWAYRLLVSCPNLSYSDICDVLKAHNDIMLQITQVAIKVSDKTQE